MPWKAVSPIEVYKLLPRTNCKECGEENCMAFAVKLVNMETKLDLCKPLLTDPKYKANYEKLRGMLSPMVKEIEIKGLKKSVKIGGEYVMHRHELTYINPTAIAIDVDDKMSKDDIVKRIEFLEQFEYEYIGRKLHLDLIAVRSVSNDPDKFKETVKFIVENTGLPMVLCSLNPKIIEAGLSELSDSKPLVYAATKDNWKEMAELVRKYEVPIVLFSPGDLNTLTTLVNTYLEMGIEDLALDPGTFVGKGLAYSINVFTKLRWKACNEDYKLAGFPLVATPLVAWKMVNGDTKQKMWWETITAIALMTRYADLLIMHSLEGWVYLPVVMWRFNLYTDPRRPVAVTPGVRVLGNPDDKSPVLVTGNYALTFSLVTSDIQSAKVDCYLLVVDTEGISIEAAVPGRKFTADAVAEALSEAKVQDMVKHKVMIIPGKAARLAGDIEDASGWKVLVGPLDSKDIGKFVSEKWKPGVLKEIFGEDVL